MNGFRYIVVLTTLVLGICVSQAQGFTPSNSYSAKPLYTISGAANNSNGMYAGQASLYSISAVSNIRFAHSINTMGAWKGTINQVGASAPASMASISTSGSTLSRPVRRLPNPWPDVVPIGDVPWLLVGVLMAAYAFGKRMARTKR